MFCKLCFFHVFLLFLGCSSAADYFVEEEDLVPPIFHLDDYDKCLQNSAHPLYCSLEVKLEPSNRKQPSTIWKEIQKAKISTLSYKYDLLRHGICVSSLFSKWDMNVTEKSDGKLKSFLSERYSKKFRKIGLRAVVTGMNCKATEQINHNALDYVIAIFFGVYALTILSSSIYESWVRRLPEKEYERITSTPAGKLFAALSLRKNCEKLTRIGEKRTDQADLSVMDGLRAYHNFLTMFIHAVFVLMASPIVNPEAAENVTRKISREPENLTFRETFRRLLLRQSAVGVQAFFMMSGMLLAYHFFQHFGKMKRRVSFKTVALIFVKRYFRLITTLVFVVTFQATWSMDLADGPVFHRYVGQEYSSCRKDWWANFLCINNIYDAPNSCLRHTWYIAADLQLFLVSLLVVWFIFNNRKYARLTIGLGIVIGLLVRGVTQHIYQHRPEHLFSLEGMHNFYRDDWRRSVTHHYPHNHFFSYMIGVMFGYILYNIKGKAIFSTKKVYIWLWYFQSLFLFLIVVMIADKCSKSNNCPELMMTFSNVVVRVVYCLIIGVFILGTTENLGGFVTRALKSSWARILGRLNFCVYLVHLIFQKYRMGSVRVTQYMNLNMLVYELIADTTISYAIAFCLCVAVEMPANNLMEMLMQGKAPDQKLNAIEKTEEPGSVNGTANSQRHEKTL